MEQCKTERLSDACWACRCNSRCRYFNCWKIFHPAAKMPPDLCEALFPQTLSLGVRKLILTSSEPLMQADLEEILRIAYNNRLHTSIVTNGLALTGWQLTASTQAGLLGYQSLGKFT